MFGSSILEVAIGLVFVYLLLSLICSAINEIIESFLKNRATDLERGIRELFNQRGGGQMATDFYNHPLINGLFRGVYARAGSSDVGFLDYLKPTNLPSYIPARNFTFAVLDLVLHPPPVGTSVVRDDAPANERAGNPAVNVSALPVSMDAVRLAIRRNFGDTQLGRALRTLAEQSGDDINALRENIEAWFDSSMDRVSGTYKRRTKWILFGLGLALTILLNVNSITITSSLANDAALRNMIVEQADTFVNNPDALKANNFEENKKRLEGLGLPIGWSQDFKFISPLNNDQFSWWNHFLFHLLGWLLTAGAISFGAPFWFDLLNKFMVIRSTVKPHEKSPEEGSEDRQVSPNSADRGIGTMRIMSLGSGSPGGGSSSAITPESDFSVAPEPDFAAPPDDEDNESHLDEGEHPILDEDETMDEDLPPSEGGVA